MATITYPDGSQLTSTALTDEQISTAMQIVTAQMLGIITDPFDVQVTLTSGQMVASVPSMLKLYAGQAISGTGIPPKTIISGLSPENNTIILSNSATVTGAQTATITDPNAFFKVRIGWQEMGQPGPPIDTDTVTVRCSTIDTDYSRMRDVTPGEVTADTISQVDVYTRAWEVIWTFYGPTSLDHSRAVVSGLITIDFVASYLAQFNLYVNPDIQPPGRNPELFQGRWWERIDLKAHFNEQITETFTVGIVKSVEVKGFTKDGQFTDFTVTTS